MMCNSIVAPFLFTFAGRGVSKDSQTNDRKPFAVYKRAAKATDVLGYRYFAKVAPLAGAYSLTGRKTWRYILWITT